MEDLSQVSFPIWLWFGASQRTRQLGPSLDKIVAEDPEQLVDVSDFMDPTFELLDELLEEDIQVPLIGLVLFQHGLYKMCRGYLGVTDRKDGAVEVFVVFGLEHPFANAEGIGIG